MYAMPGVEGGMKELAEGSRRLGRGPLLVAYMKKLVRRGGGQGCRPGGGGGESGVEG